MRLQSLIDLSMFAVGNFIWCSVYGFVLLFVCLCVCACVFEKKVMWVLCFVSFWNCKIVLIMNLNLYAGVDIVD